MKFFSIQKRQTPTHPSNQAFRLLALLALLLPLGLNTARAQTYYEVRTDCTYLVGVEQSSWTGSNGTASNDNAPFVSTADGRINKPMVEKYETNVNSTGDILSQTITSITNGDYQVVLYANACYTSGRGFNSSVQEGDMDVAYVFANDQKVYIPAHIAGSVNPNGEYSINVTVTNNTLKLGLHKDKVGTNWHTIQIKSLTRIVSSTNASDAYTTQSNYGYAIYNGQYNKYLNSSTSGTNSFDPNTCIWTGSSGSKWMNGAGYYLRVFNKNGNATFALTNSSSNASNWVLAGTESGTTGQYLYNQWTEWNRLYLYYHDDWGNVWTIDWNNYQNNVYAVTKKTYAASSTPPTISGNDVISNTGNITYSKTNASYTPGYIDYVFYNNTSHRFDMNGNAINAVPSSESFSYTWSLEGDGINSYASINNSGVINYHTHVTSDMQVTVKLTATSTSGRTLTATKTVTFDAPRVDPTGISISSANPMTVYVGQTGNITYTLSPNPCYNNVTFSSANTSIATVGTNGTVTGVAVGQTTITLQPKLINGDNASFNTTVTVTVKDKVATPVITFAPTASDDGATATTTITCATDDVTIYYKINDGTQQTYSTSFVVNDNDVVKAWAVKNNDTDDNYDDSEENTQTYVSCKLPTPTISVTSGGVSFSCSNPDATIRYTTDGSNPTESSTAWNGTTITTLADGATIKAIATSSDCGTSDIATATNHKSGVSGGVVTLNDLEDHNWAYYNGREGVKVGTADNAPDYNDKYKYTLYMPDPRNVKITYRGYNTTTNTIILGSNTVATSTLNDNTAPHVSNATDEGQNTFVYYKTLEKFVIGYFTDNADWNGIPDDPDNTAEQYPYTVISNPFSVRPSTTANSKKTYYGFGGWKIIDGGEYIQGHNDGDILNLDELIHFTGLDNGYTPNCTSAEIVLEATWAEATVWGGHEAHSFTGGTYETNFIVANDNIGSITQSSPCTIIGMYPDGTGNNSGSRTITGLTVETTKTTDPYDRSNCVKVEWIRHGDGTFNASGRNMTLGRGITSSSNNGNGKQGTVRGNNSGNVDVVNTVKVESGYYNVVTNLSNDGIGSSYAINSLVVYGCDYDRARANYYVSSSEIENNPYNIKLRVNEMVACYGSSRGNPDLHRSAGQLYVRALFKSGLFAPSTGNQEFYFHSYQHWGHRYIEMEGGYNRGHIKGGSDGSSSQKDHRAMSIRMKGGRIDGQIACGSTSTFCSGDRLVVITGGRIGGWIAPGSNCSSGGDGNTGKTDGTSYVYFGGTAEINSRQFGSSGNDLFSQSTGGVIYGAGLGYKTTDNTGEMTYGSNIVFADDAYCERGIYGGGAIGQTKTDANIFILGGRVGTGKGKVKDQGANTTYTVDAGVYGGACDRGGDNSFIYMDGGIVESGIYGGANINGTMSGNTNVRIVGGQVGTSTTSANVHGGGYGASTVVSGNVDVTLGTKTGEGDVTYTTSGDAVIYGDVYGGSALGKVNGTSSSSYHTNVTLNAGTIHGSLYGGGLGDNNTAANVYGPVAVKVYGGSVKKTDENGANGSGAVYGCNNINGAPQGNVSVVIYGTDPAPAEGQYALFSVYGGGNKADYTYDSPDVTVHNCDNSIEYVYGGGNAAAVSGTVVTIYGGNKIGNVFGGGNGISGTAADVGEIGTSVTIYGGTIGNVFGGSNSLGTIDGEILVLVSPEAYGTYCPINIDNVYGGGNMAPSQAGSLTISCGSVLTNHFHIGNVYGGANQADITGDIKLNITSGYIDNVFGGNNTSGSINGTITVNIEADPSCGMEVGNVYGGGNKAAYTAPDGNADYPQVNIIKGKVLHDVFGGGLGSSALVTGNPQVNMTGGLVGGTLYGGGSAAPVNGDPYVKMNVTTHSGLGEAKSDNWWDVKGYVFGGGLGGTAVTDGNTKVEILGTSRVGKNVYGGGNGGAVTGNTDVTIGQ